MAFWLLYQLNILFTSHEITLTSNYYAKSVKRFFLKFVDTFFYLSSLNTESLGEEEKKEEEEEEETFEVANFFNHIIYRPGVAGAVLQTAL